MNLRESWVDVAVDPAAANQQLSQRRGARLHRAWVNLRAALGRPQTVLRPESQRPPQLVYLPGVTVHCTVPDRTGPPAPWRLFVHGFSGQVEVLRSIHPGRNTAPEHARTFPYPLSEAATLDFAKKAVTRLRLGRLITLRARSTLELAVEQILHHPYWVAYRQHDSGRVSFRMLDAVTGRPTGTLTRHALLQALQSTSGDDHAERTG